MGLRLPKADLYFQKYTDSQLLARAQQVHDSMGSTAGLAIFPTPPIVLTALAALIVTYRTKLAQAVKGSKAQTQDKLDAKLQIVNFLRVTGEYVNQIVTSTFSVPGSPQQMSLARTAVLTSGFAISADPTPAANKTQGIAAPIVTMVASKEAGKLYMKVRYNNIGKRVIINPTKGKKLIQVQIRTSAVGSTPAGPWETHTRTSSSITISGLTSGVSYDYQVAVIGGRNTKLNYDNPINYTTIKSVIIV